MYIDTLIRIKNAITRKKESLKIPYSKLNMDVLESLTARGYLESVTKKGRNPKRIIDIKLKYEGAKPKIEGFKFLSKPSRRIYLGYRDIKRSRQGFGNFFLSTPKGILSDVEARKEKVGGQILFEIW